MSKNRLIFFGNERLASGITTEAPLLSGLIDAGYEVAYVVVNQADIQGRKKRDLEVETVANSHNIEVLRPERISEIESQIKESGATFGVLAAFGKILPPRFPDLFEHGILNLHPSLLPKYRGSTPIESAILNNDSQTGVSIMKLVEQMDAGPVFATATIELSPVNTKQEIFNELATSGTQLLLDKLPSILAGGCEETAQDESQASYSRTIEKSDGNIDWGKSTEQIEREIRAYLGWPNSSTTLNNVEMFITKATVTEERGSTGKVFSIENKFAVYCGKNALVIEMLKPAGKNEMDSASFLRGQRDFL